MSKDKRVNGMLNRNDGNSLKAGSSLMQSSQSWMGKKVWLHVVRSSHK